MKAFLEGRHIWWKRPQMRTDAELDIERKTTWLELFWDLVFVAVVAELSHYLHAQHDIYGILKFLFLFAPVWWIWNGVTFYNERYEANDVRHRLLTFLSMVPIIGIAYSLYGALDNTSGFFAISHIISRLLLIYMWLTAGHSALEKKLSRIFSAGLFISSSLFFASLFMEPAFKFWFWGIAIFADLVTPFFTTGLQAKLPRISRSHLPERFGLLIIITLGETVLSGLKALANNQGITLTTGLAALLSLFISFLIWWIYTDHVLYRVFKPKIWQAMSWCYLHLPLAACIIILSFMLEQLVAATTGSAMFVSVSLRWQLAVFGAAFLVLICLITMVSESQNQQYGLIDFHDRLERKMLLYKLAGASFILIIVAVFGEILNPFSLLAVAAAGLIIPIFQGLYIWVKTHMHQNLSVSSNS